MFRIGSRVVKTSLGSAVAIYIAQTIGLNFYASAGILTILCIQPTKRRSIETALRRFTACMLIILFCFVFFHFLGYNPVGIGFLLLFFIPSLVYFKLQEGLISSAVIMLHLYSLEKINLQIILNEINIILVGIGIAILCNLYMPNLEDRIKAYKEKIDTKFCFIFEKISFYLNEPSEKYYLVEYDQVLKLLDDAKNIAKLDMENHYVRASDDEDYAYLLMRGRQFLILKRVIETLSVIKVSNNQSSILAKFFLDLCYSVNPKCTGVISLHQLDEIYNMFRSMPLPHTTDDFETRAALLTIIHEMESFLIMELKFKEKYAKRNRKE